MALLKCPECSNDVSEYAKFCPKCGCTIEYIVDYHRKQKASMAKRGPKLWDSLSAKQRGFLEEFRIHLEEAKIPYFYDARNVFIGFRPKKGEDLRLYLSRHVGVKVPDFSIDLNFAARYMH